MCGQVGDTFLSFVCFVFNMGTNLSVLLWKSLEIGVVSVAVNMRRS